MMSNSFFNLVTDFFLGQTPYSAELQCFWMALQGAVAVRKGPNKDGKMAWFHAFLLSVVSSYGGALFTNIWMGKPTSMLSNDLNIAACILCFVLVNVVPFGFKACSNMPVVLITTVFATLFRSLGVVKFCNVAHEAFKDNPSPYYPIPVFGPILFATILGNMSGFFLKGFHDYIKYGMPWPFQNGLFCASFYHFIVHDETGPIGKALRSVVDIMPTWLKFGHDKDYHAMCTCFVGMFMQIILMLQLPYFLGPGFSPFNRTLNLLDNLILRTKIEVEIVPDTSTGAVNAISTKTKKRRRRKKKNSNNATNGAITSYEKKHE